MLAAAPALAVQSAIDEKGEICVYDGGAFGGYTRWAVVFLIIFVLFILLVPYWGGGGSCAGGAVAY